MTVGMGQQLLGTGIDNASCLPFRETLALGTWGFSRCLDAGTALGSSLSRAGARSGSEYRVGWTGGPVLPFGGIFWEVCDPSCPGWG